MTKWIEMAHEKRAHLFPTFWYWESFQIVGKRIRVEPGIYAQLFKNHEMSYLTEETGFTRVGEKILLELKENNLIEKIENCNNREIPELLELSEWFVDNDLSQKSGIELLKQYDLVHEQFMKLLEYSGMGTVMEFEQPLLSNYLENILHNKFQNKSKIGEYFNILTTTDRQTTPQLEEIDLRKLRIKELSDVLEKDELESHRAKYSHIFFGYDGPSWSLVEVEARMHELSNKIEVLQEEIEDIVSTSEKIFQKQKKAAVELNLSKEEFYLFKVLGILGYWKFERKLANQKSFEMIENFFIEIAHRFNLTIQQTKMILPSEMNQVLIENIVDENVLNERIKLSVAIFAGFKPPVLLVGEEARKWEIEFQTSLAVDTNIKEFKGTCAFPGFVNGVVRRIDDESEMDKFNDGEILVSTSTTPKLVPIMKKAGAIVTDSGGITSHATIVARELKVPCVIGTKIATRVLQDGDRVEVDATNGIIRKI
ncbi:MAG: PEP-utilizing enzyme [Candidatus Magasanikiibacteriota bacterium]